MRFVSVHVHATHTYIRILWLYTLQNTSYCTLLYCTSALLPPYLLKASPASGSAEWLLPTNETVWYSIPRDWGESVWSEGTLRLTWGEGAVGWPEVRVHWADLRWGCSGLTWGESAWGAWGKGALGCLRWGCSGLPEVRVQWADWGESALGWPEVRVHGVPEVRVHWAAWGEGALGCLRWGCMGCLRWGCVGCMMSALWSVHNRCAFQYAWGLIWSPRSCLTLYEWYNN